MKKLVLLLFLSLIQFTISANDIFEAANEKYQAGDFDAAIQQYEQLIAEGYLVAELHYNLGSAYFRKNDLTNAVLHFEKAAVLNPGDSNTEYNLELVKSKLPDQFEVIPDFFMSRWRNSLQDLFRPNTWGILGLLLLWTGIAGLIVWFKGNSRELRKQGFTAGILLLIVSLLPFFLGFGAAKKRANSQRAVVMVSETPLKSAPDELSEEVLLLHGGTTLSILDQIGDWKKIRLSNGEEGWLETTSLEVI